MSEDRTLPACNFLGLPEEHSRLETSAVLVLPIPYDGTTSYRSGARDGPRAIIEASRQVELYDAEFGAECALDWGIHTLPALAPDQKGPEATVSRVEGAVAEYARGGRLLAILGGEHSISIGVARGLRRVHGEFVTVQLDAHADLRDSYDGTPYSHACAARRIIEDGGEVVQLGIRSIDASEAAFIAANPARVTTITAEAMHTGHDWRKALKDRIAGRPVFLTVDLDVLDPSVMPATGTPEPDGLSYRTVLDIIRLVMAECGSLVAFDCVELAPIPGLHHPDFTAAKLVYRMINLAMRHR